MAASAWTLPGELGFYCAGNPTVYSFGLIVGDRHSQYDLWQPNPISQPEHFLGETFVLVGDLHPWLAEGFEHVEPSRPVVYYENGQPIATWQITICRGFRGFRPIELRPF